jgi:hypothetical protein
MLLLMLALQVNDDLGDVKTIEEFDFSIRAPAGWKPQRLLPPSLIKFVGPDGADIALRHVEGMWPVLLSSFLDDLKPHFEKEMPGYKIATDEEVRVGAYGGRLVAVEGRHKDGKDVTLVKSIVPRSLREFFMVDGSCDPKDAAKVTTLVRKMLGSLTIGLPLTRQEADGLAALPAVEVGATLGGEHWFRVMVKERKLGYQRWLVREEKVDGAPGCAFEADQFLTYDDGKSVHRSRGAFTPDGRVQRCDHEVEIDDAKGKRVFKESIAIRAGDAVASRDINGTRLEAKFRVPERTYLGDAADVVRRTLAARGKSVCAMRVLEPFRDEARVELLEVGAPEKTKQEGVERMLTAVMTKSARRSQLHYFYEPDGLWRLGRAALIIERCSKAEATKP